MGVDLAYVDTLNLLLNAITAGLVYLATRQLKGVLRTVRQELTQLKKIVTEERRRNRGL